MNDPDSQIFLCTFFNFPADGFLINLPNFICRNRFTLLLLLRRFQLTIKITFWVTIVVSVSTAKSTKVK
jgi:hypothetical protein